MSIIQKTSCMIDNGFIILVLALIYKHSPLVISEQYYLYYH